MNKKYLTSLRNVDGLFVISSALKDYFTRIGVRDDKIHIINMMVDASRFDEVIKSEKKERYIAYCGTATNNKDGVEQKFENINKIYKNINSPEGIGNELNKYEDKVDFIDELCTKGLIECNLKKK